MKVKLIGENKTVPTKESSLYTYFQFNGDIQATMDNFGFRI
ncbi:hypothetical protein CLQ_13778 (plasmid) [Clostridium botulinum Af84]|nr:hypothetical protein [Clostridium botulinum]APR02752.1 hypothetical protein RSJ2_3909 [Clostridium botulinum]EPS54361.1 hypothetical protein CLQ_13778 [Clostridium botulinum Af84]